MSDEWSYTEERASGALFVGAITETMIERATRKMLKLYGRDPDEPGVGGHPLWAFHTDEMREILTAALREEARA